MITRTLTLISFILLLSGALQASNKNVNMSASAKKLIEEKGLTFEEIAGETYLVRGEDLILAFDKDARFLIESNEEGQLFIESEYSRVTLTFGVKNLYLNFLNKEKGKVKKRII